MGMFPLRDFPLPSLGRTPVAIWSVYTAHGCQATWGFEGRGGICSEGGGKRDAWLTSFHCDGSRPLCHEERFRPAEVSDLVDTVREGGGLYCNGRVTHFWAESHFFIPTNMTQAKRDILRLLFIFCRADKIKVNLDFEVTEPFYGGRWNRDGPQQQKTLKGKPKGMCPCPSGNGAGRV